MLLERANKEAGPIAAPLVLRYGPIAREDLEKHAELSATEYDESSPLRSKNHLAWKFCDLPEGSATAYTLHSEERLVGRIVLQPRTFQLQGRSYRGAYLVDLLIHPDFRGIKSFLTLVKELKKTPNLDLIFLTPNATSIPLYRQVLKLPEPQKLGAFAAPLRAESLISKLGLGKLRLAGYPLSWLAAAAYKCFELAVRGLSDLQVDSNLPGENEWNSFVNSLESEQLLICSRSFQHLCWRVLTSPTVAYQPLFFRRQNKLVGFAAIRHTRYEDLNTTFVIEFLASNSLSAIDRARMTSQIISAAQAQRNDLVFGLANLSAPSTLLAKTFPFLAVPAKYLPQEVPVFAYNLTEKAEAGLDSAKLDAKLWPISCFDLDVF